MNFILNSKTQLLHIYIIVLIYINIIIYFIYIYINIQNDTKKSLMIKKSKKEKLEKQLFHIFTTMPVTLLLPELELPPSPISQRNIPLRIILVAPYTQRFPRSKSSKIRNSLLNFISPSPHPSSIEPRRPFLQLRMKTFDASFRNRVTVVFQPAQR